MVLALSHRSIPPCRRAYFLSLGRKKVAKERATPGSAPRCAGSLALLAEPGGCATRPGGPRTVLADIPRLGCVAQRLPGGSKTRVHPESAFLSAEIGGPKPLEGAEQRRLARKKGEHCPSPVRGELRSPRAGRVAQGTPEGGADPGSPFLCLLSFGEAKESDAARQARKPAVIDAANA